MMKIFVLATLILFSSCSKDVHQTQPMPVLDFSTPDNTVKSLWKLSIWRDTASVDTTYYPMLTASRQLKERDKRVRFIEKLKQKNPVDRNQIVDVQIKSDSYALVEAKEFNSPATDPNDIRYILSKEGTLWKIDDILHKCYACDATGMETDYEKQLADIKNGFYGSKPKKKCTKCNATGWLSYYRTID